MAGAARNSVPVLLFTLFLACAAPAAAGSGAPSPYEPWFTDLAEFERNQVSIYENPRLPAHKIRFCAVHKSNSVAKELEEKRYSDTLGFRNPPGTFNTGLCWFHSRYQRAATYLANFRPDLPKPSRARGAALARRIMDLDSVVEIPGYRDLSQFSAMYQDTITGILDRMGTVCFLNPTDCPQRLGDSYNPSAEELQGTMRALYDLMFQQPGQIQFLRTRPDLFTGGITRVFGAHSLLVLSIAPFRDPDAPHAPGMPAAPSGYILKTIDPNFPTDVVTVKYHFGDRTLTWSNYAITYHLAPSTHYEYAGDIGEAARAVERYCRP